MGNGVLLPGGVLSMTADAARRLISEADGDAALLYLWLLKAGGDYDTIRAAHALKWDGARADAALSRLGAMGLADPALRREVAPPPAPAEPPEYSAADINRELEDVDSPFPLLVGEVQRRLGKVLSTADLKSLYTIYDFSELPAEVILLVVSWCVEDCQRKYGPGRMPRLPQIQKEAFRWKERGVDTLEAADGYLKRLAHLRDRSVQILALLDIRDRQPVAREKEYIAAWTDMGFGDEAIRLAYEKTVLKKQTMNWPYMNSILKNWHEKGLHTVEQITAGDSRFPRRGSSAAGATAPQPAPPGEADRRAREDMERLRDFMRRQDKEGE